MNNELPSMTIKLEIIGIVRSEIKEHPGPEYPWERVVSDIIVDSSLSEALEGLDEFSHLIVLYWIGKKTTTAQVPKKIYPKHKQELPLVGFFATRTPERPNSIGQSTVRLLQRQGNILKVQRLNAINSTPVIDIKPYMPKYDMPTDIKVPKWVADL